MGLFRRVLRVAAPFFDALGLTNGKPSGDGGLIEAQAREAQQRRNQNIDRVSALFGVQSGLSARPNSPEALALQQEAEANRASREALYGRTTLGLRQLLLNDANQQKETADRNLLFSLARRGLRGGSVDVDSNNDLRRGYERGLLRIADRENGLRQQLRGQDEQTLQTLIGQINAGLDSQTALQAANQQLQGNVRDAERTAYATALGSLFAGAGEGVTAQAENQGRVAARGFVPTLPSVSNVPYYGRVGGT
jgi:hypothetical protein